MFSRTQSKNISKENKKKHGLDSMLFQLCIHINNL